MKTIVSGLMALCLLGFGSPCSAADVKVELQELIGKVRTKLKEGKRAEADLAEELKGFDALVTAHAAEKTDEVAQVLIMKAMLYTEVLEDEAKGTAVLQELKAKFPETGPAKNVDSIIANFAVKKEAQRIQASLVPGVLFPDFSVNDLEGKPLSISNYKGKVVLLDFWATWCGPCVSELPNVVNAYEKSHAKGFEIIGISLDKDKTKLTDFITSNKMPWPQYFDGKGWENSLAVKYGIKSIPATYLLDQEGKIIAKGLRGEQLGAAISKALGN